MIQRYIARAREEGWLEVGNAGRGTKGWRHNYYRCCAPDWIELGPKDERIGEHLEAQVGGVGDDTITSPPRTNGHDTLMSSPTAQRVLGDDMSNTLVTTPAPLGDDTTGNLVTTQLCRTNSRSENSRYRTPAQEEAALSRSALGRVEFKKAEEHASEPEERRFKILALANAGNPVGDIARLLRSSGVTEEEVLRVQREEIPF